MQLWENKNTAIQHLIEILNHRQLTAVSILALQLEDPMHNQSLSLFKLSKPYKVAPKLYFIMIMHRRTCLSRVMMLTNENFHGWLVNYSRPSKCKLFNSISGGVNLLVTQACPVNTCGRRACKHCMSEGAILG